MVGDADSSGGGADTALPPSTPVDADVDFADAPTPATPGTPGSEPDPVRGTIVGVWVSLYSLGTAVGPLVGSLMASRLGFRGSLSTFAVLSGVSALVQILGVKRDARTIKGQKAPGPPDAATAVAESEEFEGDARIEPLLAATRHSAAASEAV